MDIPIRQSKNNAYRRNIYIAIILFIAIGITFGILYGRTYLATKALDWSVAGYGEIIDSTVGSGNFISGAQRLVSSDEAGVLETIVKRPGESVDKGEILFQLKNPQLIQEAEAATIEMKKAKLDFDTSQESIDREVLEMTLTLSQANIDLKLAEADIAANRVLLEKGIISKLRFGQFEAALMKATNQAKAAEQRLAAQALRAKRLKAAAEQTLQLSQLKYDRLQQRIETLQLRSPISGIVKKIVPQLGDAISPGRPLAEVGPLTADAVRVRLPQHELTRLKIGLPVKLTFNSQNTAGKISRIEPDPHDGYVIAEVTAVLPESARVDMTVQSEVQFGKLVNTCYIRTLRTLDPGQTQIDIFRRRNNETSSKMKVLVKSINGYLVFPSLDCQNGDQIAIAS